MGVFPKKDNDLLELVKESKNKKENTHISNISKSQLIEGILNGFEIGNRNNGLFSFACALHNRGVSNDFILSLCSLVNNNCPTPLSSSEVSSIVNSAINYPSNNNVLEENKNGFKNTDFVTFEQAAEKWKEQITKSGDFSSGNRYPHINEVMNVTLLGDPTAPFLFFIFEIVSQSQKRNNCPKKHQLPDSLWHNL